MNVNDKLKEIQSRMPQSIKDRLFKKEKAYDKVKFIIERALEESDLTPKKRNEFEMLLKSGILDGEIVTTDAEVEKEADAWLTKEINKSIRAGELPKPKLFKRKKK